MRQEQPRDFGFESTQPNYTARTSHNQIAIVAIPGTQAILMPLSVNTMSLPVGFSGSLYASAVDDSTVHTNSTSGQRRVV